MNIILCIIDTLRYDHVGFHGNERIETPNMDRLASGSMVFDRTFTSSFPTIPHRTDVITGRYGYPFHIWMPLPFSWPTLPRLLADHGYCTQLIHDTPHLVNGGHNFDYPFHAWSMVRGAEVDRSWIDMNKDLPPNLCRDPLCDELGEDVSGSNYLSYFRANRRRKNDEDWNCARLFTTVAEFLQNNRGRDNFFLWVDSFDPHEPWDAPPEYVLKYDKTSGYDGSIDPRLLSVRNTEGVSEAIVKRIHACYAAKVSWMDHCLGKMLAALEETGLDKNTAVILTADHGTQLGERGRFGKKSPVKEQEGHIPLMIKLPGGPEGRSDILVQPQDIFATVLGIAGAAKPADMDCYDVLAQVENNKSQRTIALAGYSASMWDTLPYQFTVFDGERYLHAALEAEESVLTPMGGIENVAAEHPDTVESMHAAALRELDRRGAAPELIAWLRSRGEKAFPKNGYLYAGCPKPLGYEAYFGRLYHGE